MATQTWLVAMGGPSRDTVPAPYPQVGQGYPHDPPKVKCETMVYHPNIDLEGNVCLNILRWATATPRGATATSGVATAGSGSPSAPRDPAGWDEGANGCPVRLECGHGVAAVTLGWPRPPLWWPQRPP